MIIHSHQTLFAVFFLQAWETGVASMYASEGYNAGFVSEQELTQWRTSDRHVTNHNSKN